MGQMRMLLVRHEREVNAALVQDLWERCPPDVVKGKTPAPSWAEIGEAILAWKKKHDWRVPEARGFVSPDGVVGSYAYTLWLRPGATWDLASRRIVEVPVLRKEDGKWMVIDCSTGPIQDSSIAQWFLDKVQCPLSVVQPTFAMADALDKAVGEIGENPQDKAWPVLLYGPKLIERFGRETLLSAPVWKVEERPDGLMWLQVLENPFVAKKKDLLPLAKHLGLEVPR